MRDHLKSFHINGVTHNDDETVLMKNEGHFEHNEPMIELDLESLFDES